MSLLTAPDDPFAMMKKLRMKQQPQRTAGYNIAVCNQTTTSTTSEEVLSPKGTELIVQH